MPGPTHCWRFGPYELNVVERSLFRGQKPVRLTPKLFETLLILVRNAGHLVEREFLMRAVWKDTFVEDGNLSHNVSILRRQLRQRANGEDYIQTVSGLGYRFTAAVEPVKKLSGRSTTKQQNMSSGAIHSIGVLPFENLSHDPDQEYFADGMTEALITGLAQIVPLRVISRTSIMRYKGVRKPLPQIGEELNVDAIVEGTVFRAGKRVRLTVQLLHAAKDLHLWAKSYERDLPDVLALQRELTIAIAGEINLKLAIKRRSPTHRLSTNAYEAYLKGRYYWNLRTEQGLQKSIEYYTKAISEDSQYSLAYSGLADSYSLMASRRLGSIDPQQTMLKAKVAATKAVELDRTLAEAHMSLAFVKFQFDWDWKGAEKEFRQAIALNPNAATSHTRYAIYLATRSRMREAMSEIDHAWSLDPLSPIIPTAKGRLLHFQKKYDDAIEHQRKALAMDPNFAEAHFNLGMIYEQKSMFTEAISEFLKVIRIAGRAGFWLAGLGHAYGMAGRKDRALKILSELNRLTRHQNRVSPFDIAWVYLGLSDADRALDWMEQAFQERCTPLIYQNIEPALDVLRTNPRFQDLLRGIGFR